MAITQPYSNSASIGATEWSVTNNSSSIATQTTAGVYQLFLDMNALATGDEFQIRAYEKVTSSGTQRVVYQSNLVGPQSPPIFVLPSLALINGWDFTLKKIAGTDRTILWSVRMAS